MNMMRKRQIVEVPKGAIKERIIFVNGIFGLAT